MKKVTVFIGAFILLGILLTASILHIPEASNGEEQTPTHTHSYASEVVPPTCSYSGYTQYVCICGDAYQANPVEKLAHEYGDWSVIQAATIYNEGQEERHCLNCNEKEIKVIPKLEEHVHTYSDEVVAATCTESGFTLHTCTTCGHKSSDRPTPATGHTWSEWKVTKKATQSATGKKERTCSVCNNKETQTIPKVTPPAHTHSYSNKVVAPTCTKDGYTLHTCSCGKSYKTDAVPALGHLYGNWTTTQQATSSSTGEKECTCTRCGHTQTETIPKLEPEIADKYEQYIDPRIEIITSSPTAVMYKYLNLAVIDARTWGFRPLFALLKTTIFTLLILSRTAPKWSLLSLRCPDMFAEWLF